MRGNLVRFPSPEPQYVLDSWPVMEWLKGRQPHADWLKRMIERAERGEILLSMSMLNVGEVYYNSAREWGLERADAILGKLRQLPIELVSVSDDHVLAAARLKIQPGISYADGFAAGSAIRLNCPLITGDPEFRALRDAGILQMEWLGA